MATENPSFERGILVRQWSWPLRMAFWWVFIGVAVWASTVGVHWYWAQREQPGAPHAHQQRLLERELAVLGDLKPGVFEPRELAVWIGTSIRDTALLSAMGFARTLMNWPVEYRQRAAKARGEHVGPISADAGSDLVLQEVSGAGGTWALLVTGTYIFAARTAMYACALPLLLLAGSLGVVDGVVARALRKATAGRESASLYHRAKMGLSFVPIMGYLACLGAPSLEQAAPILVPLALLVATLLRMQAAYYKKYL